MTIITGDQHGGPFAETADVCVIGSGAGGAVAAAELAERGLSVVLLEEGSHHDPETFSARPLEMMGRLYRDRGLTAALGVPGIPVPLGRCLGGTTTINSGTCFRTPPEILATWRREHGLTLDETVLDPYFAQVEAAIGVQSAPVATLSGNASVVARGADALGWHHLPLRRNIHECRGSGVCAFGCPRSAKQSTLVSYIPRAVARGARVLTDCRAQRIRHDGRRARGVQGFVLVPGSDRRRLPFRVRARAVVLAAGSVHSPVLLRQSGLVRGPLSPVGRGLRLHPATKVAALMDEPIHAWAGVPQGYCVDQFHGEGIMMEEAFTPPEVGCIALPHLGRPHREIMEQYDRAFVLGALVSDSSTGRVIPLRGGRALMLYRINRQDHRGLARAVGLMARLAFAGGARRVFLPSASLPELKSPDELKLLETFDPPRGDLELAAFHPMGTCRMGADQRRAVVDGELRLHGLEGLWVADASVFPTSLSVNPQLSIMALATRAAEDVARYLERPAS